MHTLEVRFIIACTYLGIDIDARPKPKLIHLDGNLENCSLANLAIKTCEDIPGEVWKPIANYEDSYQVSNFGRVKRLGRVEHLNHCDRYYSDLILKPSVHPAGYLQVELKVGQKSRYAGIHRLVAETFLPNPLNLPQINHIDGDKHNNTVDNLEWCSCQDNIRHAMASGLRKHPEKGKHRPPKQVECIETGEIFSNIVQAARKLGISYHYLADRINKNKPCHGLTFRIINAEEEK